MPKKQGKTVVAKQVTIEFLQWAAGYIEGRGNFDAYRRQDQAFLLMKKEHADIFTSVWGGEWREFSHATKPDRKLMGWFTNPEEQLAILQDILPYTKIKTAIVEKYINSIQSARR